MSAERVQAMMAHPDRVEILRGLVGERWILTRNGRVIRAFADLEEAKDYAGEALEIGVWAQLASGDYLALG